jgi:hypothetical protein
MTHFSATKLALAAAVLFSLACGTCAMAQSRDSVPELAGITTPLGANASALTYWVDAPDGRHVVTTVSSGDDGGTVVRFAATLLPGQAQEISVPGPAGSAPVALRISREGRKIAVMLVSQPDAAQARLASRRPARG